MSKNFEAMLVDPSEYFDRPADILAAATLSVDQKRELLKRWEYDIREMMVADEENMPDKSGSSDELAHDRLPEIAAALSELGVDPDDTDPPTKQG